jgi:hypothetical protein
VGVVAGKKPVSLEANAMFLVALLLLLLCWESLGRRVVLPTHGFNEGGEIWVLE